MNGRSSGLLHGTSGSQISIEQNELQVIVKQNESELATITNRFDSKHAAIAGTSFYPPHIASSAKKFFKGSSNAYHCYAIYIESDGTYHFVMEKPGNVPESKAVYHKLVDRDGKTKRVYKDTFDPKGNLVHRKEK